MTGTIARSPEATGAVLAHVLRLEEALGQLAQSEEVVVRWAELLHRCLGAGGRVLAAGNGGSAAHAQHFTAELVGRYQSERRPFSAVALTADTSALTAIGNDYGFSEVFARQVEAHGRRGDVLLALSTSGRSPNLVKAVHRARRLGLTALAVTGAMPNPLGDAAHEVLEIASEDTATVQEAHQVVVHLLCEAFDELASAVTE
jgi:D-sedoheptulose 7-phosphate isomerase